MGSEKRIPIIISSLALITAIIALVMVLSKEKIGVVRTADLVAKYNGMEDARKSFEEQQGVWQTEIDTLEADYRKTVNRLNEEWKMLSASEKTKQSELASAQEENLIRYRHSLESKMQEEEHRVIEGVLHQVNDAIKQYAEDHGFDVIYGATPEGSILHSEDHLDVTDDLIERLNAEYTGTTARGGE